MRVSIIYLLNQSIYGKISVQDSRKFAFLKKQLTMSFYG